MSLVRLASSGVCWKLSSEDMLSPFCCGLKFQYVIHVCRVPCTFQNIRSSDIKRIILYPALGLLRFPDEVPCLLSHRRMHCVLVFPQGGLRGHPVSEPETMVAKRLWLVEHILAHSLFLSSPMRDIVMQLRALK